MEKMTELKFSWHFTKRSIGSQLFFMRIKMTELKFS